MRKIESREISEQVVREFGLDPSRFTIESPEVLAAILQRIAVFRCPCPPATLIGNAMECTSVLHPDGDEGLRALYGDILDDLVAYGDLAIEIDRSSGRNVRLLFLQQPVFTRRRSRYVLIHGLAAEEPDLIPVALHPRVTRIRHIRRLEIYDGEDPEQILSPFGFVEMKEERWLQLPRLGEPGEYIERLDTCLSAVKPRASALAIDVLSPDSSVRNYRNRWTKTIPLRGRFVARRPQLYGADLWCYAESEEGRLVRFLDLPVSVGVRTGWDEAWALQAAIDYHRGHPQEYQVCKQEENTGTIELFSPIPSWIVRKWQSIGAPANPKGGGLFAYSFEEADLPQEAKFLEERLWMKEEQLADSN